MSLSAKLRRAPVRAVTGAFILNSGLEKMRADADTAKGTHALAANAYPALDKVDSKVFVKALAAGEITLGAALLLPIVPAAAAGAGLMAFSGGLLGMYWRTPRMHREHDPRPTREGVPVAKDVWMFGIGTLLVLDAATAPVHTKRVQVTQQLKDSAELNAVRTALVTERATGKARRTAWGARKSAKTGAKSARAQAKVAARAARAQAEAAAKSARSQAEVGAKSARSQAKAGAKSARSQAEAGAKSARAQAKAAKALAKAATAGAKAAGHSVTTTAKGVVDALPVG